MLTADANEFMWAQKYRPKKVNDCILPEATKRMVLGAIESGEIPHLLFYGPPGMGKTTLGYAIANELKADVLYVNASMERGIDLMRTRVQQFASTMSLEDGPKIIIMDEADGVTHDGQNALKGALEAFSSNCRFIFTANRVHKIIDPIKSRCTAIDFRIDPSEKTRLAATFYKRIVEILNAEKVTFEAKVVAKLVERNFPDFRKTLNELQRYSMGGAIDSGILVNYSQENFKDLIRSLKEKDFKAMREWVGKNQDIDSSTIFRTVYDIADTAMKPQSLPNLIVILADYGYKSVFCTDQQINTTACMLEIMQGCEWE